MYKNYWSEQTGKCIAKFNVYKCSEHRFCIATKPTAYAERGFLSPITPTLWNEKIRKIDLKLDKKLKIFKEVFTKNRAKIYQKGSEKLWEIEQ